MFEIGPILRSLSRRTTIAVLIATQGAVVIAILLNLYVGISWQFEIVNQPSGIDDKNMFYINVLIAEQNLSVEGISSVVDTDLDHIRKHAEVVNAVQTISVPYSASGWNYSIEIDPTDDISGTPSLYRMIDEHGLDTMGIQLLAGRNFLPEEVTWYVPYGGTAPQLVLLSEQLAEHLFPSIPVNEVVGKQVHMTNSLTVIGVVSTCHGPWQNRSGINRASYVPYKQALESSTYLVRTSPGSRDKVIRELEQSLPNIYSDRLVREVVTIEEALKRLYTSAIASIWLLGVTSAALIFVVVCGLTGMVTFAIRRRLAHIGIRRALGATKFDIMRNLLVEYALVIGMGLVLGVILAVLLNMFLVANLDYEKLSLMPSAVVVAATAAISLLAVVLPASQANSVDPAQATRTT